MDNDVCLECRGPTTARTAGVTLPSGPLTRTWRECPGCGWESPYVDEVG